MSNTNNSMINEPLSYFSNDPDLYENDSAPKYRINMVADMIGVTAPNLRAWERRYGIPKPRRANNAYRLYSDEDVELLKIMKAFCEAGHAPSNAAKLAFSEMEHRESAEPKAYLGLHELKQTLVNAAIEFDATTIDHTLQKASQLESAWIIYEELIEPALFEIGELWESDSSYLANEHLLSHSVKSQLVQFLKVLRPPKPRKKVLLACVANELHDIPLYALALRVCHFGCLPIVIGANTPPEALHTAVQNIQPDLILLSATTALSCDPSTQVFMNEYTSIYEEALKYKEACAGLSWFIGGRATQTWKQIPQSLAEHVSSDKTDIDELLF